MTAKPSCAHYQIVEHIWTESAQTAPPRTWSWIECKRYGTVLEGMKVTPMAETEREDATLAREAQ